MRPLIELRYGPTVDFSDVSTSIDFRADFHSISKIILRVISVVDEVCLGRLVCSGLKIAEQGNLGRFTIWLDLN